MACVKIIPGPRRLNTTSTFTSTSATSERQAEPVTEERIMGELPEYVDGLPNICGAEDRIDAAVREGRKQPVFLPAGTQGFGDIESTFAIALHMHQPLIPAG